jgi:NAD(P)-dependent dehydrogenase (short-subunit alcohol dehydrogenase family)
MTKTVVITGATSGIGKELVEQYKDDDYVVFYGYRNPDKIDKNLSENVIPFYINLSDRQSILKAADFIKSKTEHVDILLNVAGSVVAGPVELLDSDKLREQFEVNVFSHIDFSQYLLPVLTNGTIINISSMSSFGHFPFISPYCASKRSLDIFFNAFAVENHKNIRVISVKPGVIPTPIWEKSVENNSKMLTACADYQNEMEFIKLNALRNTNRGLDVKYVAKFIKKVSEKKNPRASYTLGADAKFAEFMSCLPQDWINKIVKFGLRSRIKKHLSKRS